MEERCPMYLSHSSPSVKSYTENRHFFLNIFLAGVFMSPPQTPRFRASTKCSYVAFQGCTHHLSYIMLSPWSSPPPFPRFCQGNSIPWDLVKLDVSVWHEALEITHIFAWSIARFFSSLSRTPSYGCTTITLIIPLLTFWHPCKDISAVSSLELLEIRVMWMFTYR